MPWRKDWIDPADFEGREEELGKVLSKRAYEVWVSEVSKWLLVHDAFGTRNRGVTWTHVFGRHDTAAFSVSTLY